LIGILSFAAACAGLFWPGGEDSYIFTSLRGQPVEMFGRGLYAHDTLMVGAGFQGTDIISLFIALPLLAIAYRRTQRGSVKDTLFLAGALMFFLYIGASLSFAAAYNPLFLIYVALMSASLFALLLTLQAIDPAALGNRISDAMPRSAMTAYFIFAGAGRLFLWGSEIAASWQSGLMPEFLASYTTIVTHGIDMGLVAPATFIAAAWLSKGNANGVRFGLPLALLNILIGLCVISQTVMQLRAGVIFSTGQLIGMIGSWLLLAGFATWTVISMTRHVRS